MRNIQRNRDYLQVGHVFKGSSKPWGNCKTFREITAVDWEGGSISWKQVGAPLETHHHQRPEGTMKIISFIMWADRYVNKAELEATEIWDLVKVTLTPELSRGNYQFS